MKFSKILFSLFIALMLLFSYKISNANHMYGGEVSYKCVGGNVFEFTVVLYQNCLTEDARAAITQDNPLNYAIFENTTGYPLVKHGIRYFISQEDLLHGFSNDCVENIPSTCLKKTTFIFEIELEPTAFGYTIAYQRCCRNMGIINLVSSGNIGVTYQAIIPPFVNGECPNNSPIFKNNPPQIICANEPFEYDYSATDIDGDSLVYKFCPTYVGANMTNPIPLGTEVSSPPFSQAIYNGGLTYDNPINSFPSPFIDPQSGILSLNPTTSGRYQVTVCVDQYKGGIFINSHARDLQFVIANCNKKVISSLPTLPSQPNVFKVECNSYTVQFEHNSTGAVEFAWDFGDGSPESNEEFPSHTYADTGVYEVKLTINRSKACNDSTRKLVKVYPFYTADFEIIGKRCPGEPIKFEESISFMGENTPVSYEWDFGDGTTFSGSNPTHTYDIGGLYIVRFITKSKFGCEEIVEKQLDIRPFKPNAGNDTIIVLGYDFNLNASGGDSYSWSPSTYLSDPNIANPKTNFPDTGTYTYVVEIQSEEGCGGLDTINVLVVHNPSILLPNAFSPNGDGLNDVFRPKIVGYPFINYMKVFNRWGQLVFVSYKASDGWDGTYSNGKIGDAGVYFYEISVRSLDGSEKYQKGDVTLIR